MLCLSDKAHFDVFIWRTPYRFSLRTNFEAKIKRALNLFGRFFVVFIAFHCLVYLNTFDMCALCCVGPSWALFSVFRALISLDSAECCVSAFVDRNNFGAAAATVVGELLLNA